MYMGGLKQSRSWGYQPGKCSMDMPAGHCPQDRAEGSAFCAEHKALLSGRRPGVTVETKSRTQDTKHGAG